MTTAISHGTMEMMERGGEDLLEPMTELDIKAKFSVRTAERQDFEDALNKVINQFSS